MKNIDTHAHFFPERFIELVAKHGGRCGTTVTSDASGARFIQVGLTLQLQDAATGEAVKAFMPSIRSQILLLLSQRTADEVLQVHGKEKLSADIIAAVSETMGYPVPEAEDPDADAKPKKKRKKAEPSPVQAVLFSSFIVQ